VHGLFESRESSRPEIRVKETLGASAGRAAAAVKSGSDRDAASAGVPARSQNDDRSMSDALILDTTGLINERLTCEVP
jgi:hypothetical protein